MTVATRRSAAAAKPDRGYADTTAKLVHDNNFYENFSELFGLDVFLKRFAIHRVTGMLYLVQYVASVLLLMFNYELYASSPLPYTLPINGLIQSIVAARTFTFLPKGKENGVQGFFSDKRTVTHGFIVENAFFAGLLVWQALNVSGLHQTLHTPRSLDLIIQFLPYALIRPLFPKTSLGSSRNLEKQYTDSNKYFLKATSLITKVFYVGAKHFNGYYLSWVIFLGGVRNDPQAMRVAHTLLVVGGWPLTIGMFVNTLKYKGMVGPRTALASYVAAFPPIVLGLTWLQLRYAALGLGWVSAVVGIGIPINFLPKWTRAQHLYAAYVLFCMLKYENLLQTGERGPTSLFDFYFGWYDAM